MKESFDDLYIAYTQFNASRALSTDADSNFRVERYGDVTALIDEARGCPSICNRVLGFDADYVEQMPDIISHYGQSDPQFDLAPHAICESVVDALISRGYRPCYALSYLKGEARPLPESNVHVERWGPEQADAFLELLKTSGVKCSDAVWDKRRQHYCTDTFPTFVAYVDDEPCAWATLFVNGTSGVLANAFTLETHRHLGCHRSLLNHRLADAATLGLNTMMTDVLHNTVSYHNCMRCGFQLETIHTIWRKVLKD